MRRIKRIFSVIITITFLIPFTSYGQLDLGTFISTGAEDARQLVGGYTSPMLRALGNNFNTGWYNTAEPLKPGRFDIRIIPSVSIIPSYDRQFNVGVLDLTHVEVVGSDNLPTMFGESGDYLIKLIAQDGNSQIETEGDISVPVLGINLWPGITPQFNIGIFRGTEFMIRYLPPMELNISTELNKPLKTKYFGLGIKHDIKQWIPGFEDAPVDFSIGVAWFKGQVMIDGPFLSMADVNDIYGGGIETEYEIDTDTQNADLTTKGYRVDFLVSKKIALLTIYGGIGYSNSTTLFNVSGEYPFVDYNNVDDIWIAKKLENPISIEEKISHMELSGGIRIKLAIISLSVGGAYSPTGYSTVHFGLGLGYFN